MHPGSISSDREEILSISFLTMKLSENITGRNQEYLIFLLHLPAAILKKTPFRFMTPTEVADHLQPVSAISVPHQYHGLMKNAI